MAKAETKPWSSQEIDKLKALWATTPVKELAVIFGRSVDSVYSRGRDVRLPPRKALAELSDDEKFARTAAKTAVRDLLKPKAKTSPPKKPKAEEEVTNRVQPRSKRQPAVITRPLRCEGHPLLKVTKTGCRWPFGAPGERDFHFCGDKVIEGKPYCREHCQKAYQQRAVSHLPRSLEQA